MHSDRRQCGGWRIVGWVAAGLAVMVVAILGVYGFNEESLGIVLRRTADTSCLLFLSAFVASPLQALRPDSPFLRTLVRNRRYVGVSFAVSHGYHALAILTFGAITTKPFYAQMSWKALAAGGLGYLFILMMAATSCDRAAAWLGPTAWKRLHTVGLYYLALEFINQFRGKAMSGSRLAWVFLALLGTAAMLRAVAWLDRRGRPEVA